jgi:putative heme-binding domain-containing protein
MMDLLPHLSKLDNLETRRHLARGRNVFMEAHCVLCHHFENGGGSFGPDLTAVGSRMATRDILESILEPSKVVADQYKNTIFTLKNGDVLTGRVLDETDAKFLVLTDPVRMTRANIPKWNVESHRLSNVSPMPEGLVNTFTEDEIWDLIACLKSGARTHPPAAISSK